MTGVPYDLNDIERVLGFRGRERARNKRRGGTAANLGYQYETSVALTFLIEAAAEASSKKGKDVGETMFVEQPLGFADDLLIVRQGIHEFYQIKREETKASNASRARVRQDLSTQYDLLEKLEIPGRVLLVVGDETIEQSYVHRIRNLRFDATIVSREPMPQRVWHETRVRDAVLRLLGNGRIAARVHEPSLVYNVCRAFKSAWDGLDGRGPLRDFVREASTLCRGVYGLDAVIPRTQDVLLLGGIQDTTFNVVGRCLVADNDIDDDLTVFEFANQRHWNRVFNGLSHVEPPATLREFRYWMAKDP